jgi:hypothetical protein
LCVHNADLNERILLQALEYDHARGRAPFSPTVTKGDGMRLRDPAAARLVELIYEQLKRGLWASRLES